MKTLVLSLSLAAVLAGTTAAATGPAVARAPGLVVSHGGKLFANGRRIANGTQPAWSPDGRRVAFERFGEIHVVDADGRNERRLTVRRPGLHWPANGPAWSPDGTRIVFSGTRDIFTVDLATRALVRLTHTEKSWLGNYTPAYSPDGRRIAFSRSTDAFNSDIFLMNANGKHLVRLTKTQGTDSKQGEEHGPTWSPDGRTIVFVSNRDPRSWELWSIGVNGSGERRITETPAPRYDEDAPRFSADGKRLLYAHDGHVAMIRADGTGVRELGLGTSADWK